MKVFIFALVCFGFCAAQASNGGALFLNADNTQAKLVLNESREDGGLSKLFDQMQIDPTGSETTKRKSMQMANGRFSFVCNKAVLIVSPPATSCTFVISAGENSNDVTTTITKSSVHKNASIAVNGTLSQALKGIFPADANESVDYLFKTENEASLKVLGSVGGALTIEFAQ